MQNSQSGQHDGRTPPSLLESTSETSSELFRPGVRPIFYQFTPHLHSDDSSTDVSSCSGSDLSCLHDGDDERSESDLGGHHRNEENEGVGEDCEGLDGEVTEGNENLVHVMMNEMRDDEGDESEAPQRRFPQLMGPQGIHQRQVAIPTSTGVLSAMICRRLSFSRSLHSKAIIRSRISLRCTGYARADKQNYPFWLTLQHGTAHCPFSCSTRDRLNRFKGLKIL